MLAKSPLYYTVHTCMKKDVSIEPRFERVCACKHGSMLSLGHVIERMQDMTVKPRYLVDVCCKHVGILCSETILKSVSDRLHLLP